MKWANERVLALGSMVGPAAASGLFGIRPTHGLISCEGIVPVSA